VVSAGGFFISMDFLILALATFRISSLIADEDGPLGLFEWLRSRIGVERDTQGKTYGTNNFSVGLVCQWCNSIWIGVILMLLYMTTKQITVWICFPLALSAVTMILERWINGNKL
jgi:hypothetical protein